MDMNFDLYMNGVVEQARNEIESAGYEQLTTAEDVDKVLKQDVRCIFTTGKARLAEGKSRLHKKDQHGCQEHPYGIY